MKIILYDGSIIKCNSLLITDEEIIVDNTKIVPLIEVQRIKEDDE